MGAHRTETCNRCDQTFRGSKRDIEHAMGVHICNDHPHVIDALNHAEPSPETLDSLMPRQWGHECPSARAITPLYDGWCDWCGKRVTGVYEWFIPQSRTLLPFWRRPEWVNA